MSMLFVLALPPIVTLSEFVAESADKRVEIFAGQIFDLACAKTAKPKDFAGYSCPWHYRHTALLLFLKKQFFPHGNDVQTPTIPLACCAARLCATRLRLDCTKFRRVCSADLLKVTIKSIVNTICAVCTNILKVTLTTTTDTTGVFTPFF